jgi:transglutaminase-like putative cysteine protease
VVKRLLPFVPTLLAALLLAAVLAAEAGEQSPDWSVSTLARSVSLACLVASAIGGVLPKRADVRRHASVTLAIFAVTAIGQSRMREVPESVYRVGCLIFVLVAIATLRAPRASAHDSAILGGFGRINNRPVPTRGRTVYIFAIAVFASAIAGFLISKLPGASRAAERRVSRYFEKYASAEDEVGFSSTLSLGSTRGMLQSNKVVMRLDGADVDYLRGAVLDEYDTHRQRWTSNLDTARIEVVANTPQEQTATRIRMAQGAPVARGVEARWFLPANTCDIHVDSGHVTVDRAGIAHPDPPAAAYKIAFRSGAVCRESASAIAVPGPAIPRLMDLALSPRLRAKLAPVAALWVEGKKTDRERLDAMTRELSGFGYSLEVTRNPRMDAVVDFLTVHREGHCELFASALALLGRTQGIPTRLVSGYRVSEVNPVTSLTIVRERNAHTWVEAWVDGAWETWDPTPISEVMLRSRPGLWDHVSELAAWAWDRTVTAFWHIRIVHVGIGAGALAVVLLIARQLTQERARKAAASERATSRPLPAFETLAAALERAGWGRSDAEPLERFAERLQACGEAWASDVARALVVYADLRYGGIGEEPLVSAQLDALAKKVPPGT